MIFADALKTKATVLILIVVFAAGCSSQNKPTPIDPNDVESIYFGTVVKGVETIAAVTKFKDVPLLSSYRDTVIYSEEINYQTLYKLGQQSGVFRRAESLC